MTLLLPLALWCTCLAVIDLRVRRLPNFLTIPGAIAILAFAYIAGNGRAALVGGLLLAGLYLLVHLLAPRALGAGDVKLALGLGAAAALGGADAWVLAAFLAPMGTAIAGGVLMVSRARTEGPTVLPHGPSMCGATLIALALAT